jgi:hypothetical protein
MSQAVAERPRITRIQPRRSDPLPPAKKAAVLIATVGVLGFSIGWMLSLLNGDWTGTELGAIGFALGAMLGCFVGRLATRMPRG